jgi:hypothetical protein
MQSIKGKVMSSTISGVKMVYSTNGNSFAPTCTVKPAPEILCCELHGEAVILNLKTGVYHGLDGVGARIWQLIQEPRTVEEICITLMDEYQVEKQRCETEVCSFLATLTDLNLALVRE